MTTRNDVEAVCSSMRTFARPWFVSGGWAIDLHANRISREHEDLEIGIFREDQWLLREHLTGWTWEKVVNDRGDGKWVAWTMGEWLELPIHQTRALHDRRKPRVFEVFLNEHDEESWRFRRMPSICRSRGGVACRTEEGIPYLASEVQLLYKARLHRPKDDEDFALVRDSLSLEQRSWLRDALQRFVPGDSWLDDL